VIVFPHVGGSAQSQVNGLPLTGEAIPHKKTELTPNLGAIDSADDIRGGMGIEGPRTSRSSCRTAGRSSSKDRRA
jgi:hypothetical protein